MSRKKEEPLERKKTAIEATERSDPTQESNKGKDFTFPHSSTIIDLSNDDDLVQENQQDVKPSEDDKLNDQKDSTQRAESIGKIDELEDKETNSIERSKHPPKGTAELIIGLIGGISSLMEYIPFVFVSKNALVYLLFLPSIIGIIGAFIVRSNTKIGSLIMIAAGLILLFGLINFGGVPFLIAGMMGLLRKN